MGCPKMSALAEVVVRLMSSEAEPGEVTSLQHLRDLRSLAVAVDREYEPSHASGSRFIDRIEKFVLAANSPADQAVLLKLASEMTFVDRTLFSGLLSSAFEDRVLPWLARQAGIDFAAPDLESRLSSALEKTLFLSITDSFSVGEFLRANKIPDKRWRPDIRSLKKFSTVEVVADALSGESFEYYVALEDFIGSGTQSGGPLSFLAKVAGAKPSLVVPLVICHQGLAKILRSGSRQPNLSIDPVLILRSAHLLALGADGRNDADATEYRRVLAMIDSEVDADHDTDYAGFLGFGEIGALYARFSNCPNNSVGALHHSSSRWSPPFPRVNR